MMDWWRMKDGLDDGDWIVGWLELWHGLFANCAQGQTERRYGH